MSTPDSGDRTLSVRRRIAHIHIPKCGGTTITSYLRRVLGADAVAHFGRQSETAEFRRAPREKYDECISVGGHITYARLFDKFGDSRLYFATIRDPFDLFVSFYQDVSTREGHPLKSDAARMSPLEFLDLVTASKMILPQITFFTHDNSVTEALRMIDEGAIHVEILPRLNGLLEELTAYLGAPRRTILHKNRSQKLDLEGYDRLRAAVRRNFPVDCELYDFVASRPRPPLGRATPT